MRHTIHCFQPPEALLQTNLDVAWGGSFPRAYEPSPRYGGLASARAMSFMATQDRGGVLAFRAVIPWKVCGLRHVLMGLAALTWEGGGVCQGELGLARPKT